MVILALSGLGGVLALIVLVQGLRDSIVSGLVGAIFASAFAVVTIVASVMGVLTGLGRLRGAEPLTAFCIGGVFCVSAVLSDPSIAARALGRPASSLVLAGMNIRWIMLALLALGVLMMGLAALTTITRDRRAAVPSVAWGVAWGVPLLAMATLWKLGSTRGAILALPGWALAIVALLGMILLVVCASASIHYLVKGFAAAAHTSRGEPTPGNAPREGVPAGQGTLEPGTPSPQQ